MTNLLTNANVLGLDLEVDNLFHRMKILKFVMETLSKWLLDVLCPD